MKSSKNDFIVQNAYLYYSMWIQIYNVLKVIHEAEKK